MFQLPHIAPIGIHQVNVEFAISCNLNHRATSVVHYQMRMLGQVAKVSSIGVHYINLLILIAIE